MPASAAVLHPARTVSPLPAAESHTTGNGASKRHSKKKTKIISSSAAGYHTRRIVWLQCHTNCGDLWSYVCLVWLGAQQFSLPDDQKNSKTKQVHAKTHHTAHGIHTRPMPAQHPEMHAGKYAGKALRVMPWLFKQQTASNWGGPCMRLHGCPSRQVV
jgi:hypothetical protein